MCVCMSVSECFQWMAHLGVGFHGKVPMAGTCVCAWVWVNALHEWPIWVLFFTVKCLWQVLWKCNIINMTFCYSWQPYIKTQVAVSLVLPGSNMKSGDIYKTDSSPVSLHSELTVCLLLYIQSQAYPIYTHLQKWVKHPCGKELTKQCLHSCCSVLNLKHPNDQLPSVPAHHGHDMTTQHTSKKPGLSQQGLVAAAVLQWKGNGCWDRSLGLLHIWSR